MAPPKLPKLSTNDFLIVFGPQNTYLARAPSINRSSLVTSPNLSAIIDDAKTISFVVFPPKETPDASATIDADDLAESADEDSLLDPYIAYAKKGILGDSKFYFPPESNYPELKDWLDHRWGTGGLQVVGNGEGGWWGLSTSGNTKWFKLPGDVRQLLKPANPHGKVVHMALGIKGSYITVFEDGHVDWDLKGSYDRLDEHLEGRTQGELVYASLSVYRPDQFFAVFRDATAIYEFPDGSGELDEDFLAAESLRVVVESETAKHTGMPISKAEKSSALRKFSATVLTDVAEKGVEGLLT